MTIGPAPMMSTVSMSVRFGMGLARTKPRRGGPPGARILWGFRLGRPYRGKAGEGEPLVGRPGAGQRASLGLPCGDPRTNARTSSVVQGGDLLMASALTDCHPTYGSRRGCFMVAAGRNWLGAGTNDASRTAFIACRDCVCSRLPDGGSVRRLAVGAIVRVSPRLVRWGVAGHGECRALWRLSRGRRP